MPKTVTAHASATLRRHLSSANACLRSPPSLLPADLTRSGFACAALRRR